MEKELSNSLCLSNNVLIAINKVRCFSFIKLYLARFDELNIVNPNHLYEKNDTIIHNTDQNNFIRLFVIILYGVETMELTQIQEIKEVEEKIIILPEIDQIINLKKYILL